AGGFTGSLIASGGDVGAALKGGAIGGVTAGLFNIAGGIGNEANSLSRYAAHAGAGCVGGMLQGNGCARGAASAVLAKYVTNMTKGWDEAYQASASIVAGGTLSVITGGKFENGAVNAAFAYLYNFLSHASFDRKSGVLDVQDGN